MSGASDLQGVVDAIQRLCVDVRQVIAMTEEMLTGLQFALDEMQRLAGPPARSAEAQVRVAQEALREVQMIWLTDYLRQSEELCRKIGS